MNKPESNAKQIQISSAHRIDVVRLLDKYKNNKSVLASRCYSDAGESLIKDHQNTLETIFTALNVPIPQ